MKHTGIEGRTGDPLVSVVVPVYNVEPYLRQCLDSVCGQTYGNLEIILVDDGSKDQSGAVCDEYVAADPRIQCVHQKNGGLSCARNCGMERATGDYLMFIDSDDWIELHTVEQAVSLALRENADMVMWNYVREFEDRTIPGVSVYEDERVWRGTEAREVYLRILGPTGQQLSNPASLDSLSSAVMKLYRMEWIRETGVRFVDHAIIGSCEDTMFHIQLCKTARCVVYIKDYLYHYRKTNSASITNSLNRSVWAQRKRMYEIIEDSLDESDTRAQEALLNRIACSLIGVGLIYMHPSLSRREGRRDIRMIMRDPMYRKAVKQLRLGSMPLHWKVFFLCAKWNWTGGVCLLLRTLQYLKGRV